MKLIYKTMNKLSKYNFFLLEKQFQSIIDDIFRLVESDGKWTGDNTYEWDMEEDNSIKGKLKKFLSNLPKEEIKKYFWKLIDKVKSLPDNIRKKLIINYAAVFLAFVSVGYLIPNDTDGENISSDIKTEVISTFNNLKSKMENKVSKSSFEKAQGIVKQVEAGYSNDKGDTGNWIKVPGGKRFVGTNHGISAPILAEYLGRLPKKEDMVNLSYKTALKIYKKNYWDAQNLGDFNDQSIANILYDGSVNQGKTGMQSVLRNALNDNGVQISDDDNPFNIEWVKKINKLDQKSLFESIKKFREERYKEAATFKRHGSGWLDRLSSFEYEENNKLT
jgi:lysozyme family protein